MFFQPLTSGHLTKQNATLVSRLIELYNDVFCIIQEKCNYHNCFFLSSERHVSPSPSQSGALRIKSLSDILHDISQAGEEDASDPFTSTFEALRVMKTTISKLNTVVPTESAHSDSSSEYTTPAQSQTTSPTREMSPPSFSVPSPDSTVKGLLALGIGQDQVKRRKCTALSFFWTASFALPCVVTCIYIALGIG